MSRAVVAGLLVLGLAGSLSVEAAQGPNTPQASRWTGTMHCSDGIGTGPMELTLTGDTTCAVMWKMECLGFNVVSSPVKGDYRLKDSKLTVVVRGFARTHHGPSSWYEAHFSGTLGEAKGQGTFEITFFEEDHTGRGWPPEETGTWELVRVK